MRFTELCPNCQLSFQTEKFVIPALQKIQNDSTTDSLLSKSSQGIAAFLKKWMTHLVRQELALHIFSRGKWSFHTTELPVFWYDVAHLVLSTEERRNFFYANKTPTLILSVKTSIQLEGCSISSLKCQSAQIFCTIHQTVETLVAFTVKDPALVRQYYQQCNDTKLVEKHLIKHLFCPCQGLDLPHFTNLGYPWVSTCLGACVRSLCMAICVVFCL